MRRARIVCVTLAAGCALFVGSFAVAPYRVHEFEEVRAAWRASDAWLLDRSGERLSRVRVKQDRRRGEWTGTNDVSPPLLEMLFESEDRRFRLHGGADWLALAAAVRQTIAGERRGGSTLTMQLAAYLNPELDIAGRRDVFEKWRQVRQALAIERSWTKDQILEAWLNLTPFRGELEGVDAASRALFGKRSTGLDRAESALLAALVRAPNARARSVTRRACALLRSVPEHGAAVEPGASHAPPSAAEASSNECLSAQSIAAAGLRPRGIDADLDGIAPHLAHRLLKDAGQDVRTTLDARLQRFALSTLTRHLRELEGRQVEDGALVVFDNDSGDVLAWVGSSGALSRAQEVDGVMAKRQAGSTLKPFLYALAIERTLLTAASVLDDSPLALTLPTGMYVPQNYDRGFKGRVSLRQALASSLNVPAVRTVALTGCDAFYLQLRAVGIELPREADYYGYSLALGGADVSLLQLANAYRTLANGGRFGSVKTRPTLTLPRESADSRRKAVDPRAAFIVSDILADSAARALTFGLAGPLATRYRASVKTGTSKDMRDNWAVGYAGRYTVGVWVGNFSGAPMHDVSGVDGAAPVWREVMDYLQAGAAPEAPSVPEGLVRLPVTYAGVGEPQRDEWFIAGTETSRVVSLGASPVQPRIASPAQGAIYAIDPDIPRDRQRLTVAARGAPKGARFVLEDGTHARADRPLLWLPPPGHRTVVLRGADGRELDRVKFEVRGLPPRRQTAKEPR